MDAHVASAERNASKAILITGSSSGIGHRMTVHLAGKGYFIYAGVRRESDRALLDAIENVQAIKLDVTQPADISAAVQVVTRGGKGLYGLINNAGVATSGEV